MSAYATLLLLADSRFPTGAHAHSGGLEAAVASGRVHDVVSLEAFLLGRLGTVGLVAASFAAAAASGASVAELDAELSARTASPVQRRVSRQLGRHLVRAAAACWPAPVGMSAGWVELSSLHPDGPHQPVALGVVASAAGLAAEQAAAIAALGAISGPATAAVRLLGLDPFGVQRVLTACAPRVDEVARVAAGASGSLPSLLPTAAAPRLDIDAERHAAWEVRLFAS